MHVGTPKRQVGDLYASFIDTDRIEELGLAPLQAVMSEVAAVDSVEALGRALGRLARDGVVGVLQHFVSPDERSPEDYVVYLEQGGLGLPDESYYREEKYADIRTAYVAHIGRLLGLAGIPDAEAKATRIMTLETLLAASHWDTVSNRDAIKTYNAHTIDEVMVLAPQFPWHDWLSGLGAPAGSFDKVVVRQPSFVAGLGAALESVDIADWRAWLTWHVLSEFASLLPQSFVDEDFDFYGRTLSGQPENKERWKRGVSVVEACVGEAVGQLYAERWFPPAAKARMQELVGNLVEAFRRSFASLEWMGPETRAQAIDKLDAFTPKIGYPDVWRDYSSIEIDPADLVGNVRRSTAFEVDRNLAKIGRPIDRTEWFMLPQTVNAYYMPSMNEIVFPAAILQPPFFDLEADDAVNYGGIGAVIGHELGHGFDDQGSRYDGTGALRDWWTEADRERFDALSQRLIEQFGQYTPAGLSEDAQGQRRPDGRREHRRPRWPADRLLGLSHRDRDRRDARARRLHRTAALLHRVGPGLEGQGPRGRGDPAARRRPALAAGRAGQRRAQRGGVPRRVRRQARRRDVARRGPAGPDLLIGGGTAATDPVGSARGVSRRAAA